MKALVRHDKEGNIRGLVTVPADAPMPVLVSPTGEILSEVELPESLLAVEDDPNSDLSRIRQLLGDYLVKFDRKAQLVHKDKEIG
jgi:hypothetical protein